MATIQPGRTAQIENGPAQCTMCNDSYKRPKLLPCFHSFCASCLETYITRMRQSGGYFDCPLCQKNIKVPTNGVKGFQNNVYIDAAEAADINEPTPCDGCRSTKKSMAEHRCLDCDDNFCSPCAEIHLNMKLTRGHHLMELGMSNQQTKPSIKSRVYCTQHPAEEVKVFCRQCDKLLCVLCMLADHHGHRSKEEEVKIEAVEVRKKLKQAIDDREMKETVKRQTQKVAQLRSRGEKLETNLTEEIRAVRAQGSNLHQAVDALMKQMEATLTNEYMVAKQDNHFRLQEAETYHSSLTSLLTTGERIIEQETDAGVIQKGNALSVKLVSERKKEKPPRPWPLDGPAKLFSSGAIDGVKLHEMIGRVRRFSSAVLPIDRPVKTSYSNRTITSYKNKK